MSEEPVPLKQSLDAVVRALQRGAGRYASGARSRPRGRTDGPDDAPADSGDGVGGRRPTGAASMGAVFGRWDEIVGSVVAAHVQPVRLDGDRLTVEVDDPAWATQWKFLDADLRARLETETGVRVATVEVRVRRR